MDMFRKLTAIFSIIIMGSGYCTAESFDYEAGIGRFINTAMKNRMEIAISLEQDKLSRLRILQASRVLGPALMLQYTESEGKTITDPFKAQSYSARANQTIFQGGKKYYTLKTELFGLDIAKTNIYRVKQGIKFEVAKNYYTALLLRKKLDNIIKLLDNLKDEFMLVDKKFMASIITQIDYLEIIDLKEELILQKKLLEGDLSIAKSNLKLASGEEYDIVIDLSNDILQAAISYLEFTLEEYRGITMKKRPELKSVEILIQQTYYVEKAAKADRWPGIAIEGTIGKSGEAFVDQKLDLATEWSVFANLKWLFWGSSLAYKFGKRRTDPTEILDTSVRTETNEKLFQMSILDRLDYYYTKQEKKVTHLQALKDRDQTINKAMIEVERAYNNFKRTTELIKIHLRKMTLSEKKMKIIKKRKLLGEASSKDLINAMMKYNSQNDAYLEAIAKNNISFAELKISCGINVHPVINLIP